MSYEIHPVVPGGCGVLLHNSARVLLEQGHEIVFLLDVDPESFKRFNEIERLKLPKPENCRAYLVEELVRELNIPPFLFGTLYEHKAYRFYQAARLLAELENPEIFEFFDYCGVAYYALSAKIAGLDFCSSHLAIRLHSSMELIDRQQPGSRHGIDRYIMYGLEHQGLRLAETVLYPSEGYLQEHYLKTYEPWFGRQVQSQPALLDYPIPSGESANSNIVLFYGRLFGIKGVDIFIDAAIHYLNKPENPRRRFYLVGYDSHLPPTGRGSYQDYLLKKIPAHQREFFAFPGLLPWPEFARLLPEVLFAVIPSYFESYCYAAHELYEAGVPLILADIPAFRDFFQHGENALKFDGTVSDLGEKMRLLSTDETLRSRLKRPYTIHEQMLGDFYSTAPKESWIKTGDLGKMPELLICILVDEPSGLEVTLKSIPNDSSQNIRVMLMFPVAEKNPTESKGAGAYTWFLGRMYLPQDLQGNPINPIGIQTAEALLILKSGDILEPDYLPRSLAILRCQPQIAFVGCWKNKRQGGRYRIDTLPLDAIMEIIPYLRSNPINRFVMRTEPGRLLIDLFDPRAGRLGELDYLWRQVTPQTSGVLIPQAFVTCHEREKDLLDQPTLDYLILKDTDPVRKERLARFNLSLANRSKVLRRFQYDRDLGHPILFPLHRAIHKLATSRVSKWMDRLPWLKKVLRISLISFWAVTNRLLVLLRRNPFRP